MTLLFRIKCLEFLYFYLLPEEVSTISGANADQALCPQKSTPVDAGLQTSRDTVFNTLSGATMIDCGYSPLPPPPVSMITITPASSDESVASSTSPDSRPFVPNPKIHELRLLTKDLDFTPSTPTKKRQQIADLGVGTPHTPNRKTKGAVSDHNTPSKLDSNFAAGKINIPSDMEPGTLSRRQEMHKALSTGNNQELTHDLTSSSLMDFGVFVTPNPMYQGGNVIFPSESGSCAGGTSSDRSTGSAGTIDLTWGPPRRANDIGTPSRRGERHLRHTGPVAAGGTPMRKTKSEVHPPSRHMHSKSEASMLGSGAKSVLMVRSQSVNEIGPMAPAPIDGINIGPRGRTIKSTREKKELLGTCLGNVDALVEGMKKAGAWGLV